MRGKVTRETEGQTEWKRRRGFGEIVGMVERVKRERWEAFRDRCGDWGRDLALWAGRQYGGADAAGSGR
jgi:hypothetical protein